MIPEPSEAEIALYCIFKDDSGIDQAEFCLEDPRSPEGIFRAWPVQIFWWRRRSAKCLSAGSRSIGKSLGASIRAAFFPFVYPGEEMVITAPEGVHLDALTDTIETTLTTNFMAKSMLAQDKRSRIKHRPFLVNFANKGRLIGRIPKHDGSGVKGSVAKGTLVLTRDRGLIEVEKLDKTDYVWSHKSRWCKVESVYKIPKQKAFKVSGQGSFPVVVNEDHRFYARNDVSSQPGKTKRHLGKYTWEYPIELTSSKYQKINAYWVSPICFGQELPVPEVNWNINSCEINDDFWWLVGRFLADGYTSQENGHRGRIHILAHPKDQKVIIEKYDSLGFNYSIKKRSHSSADDLEICSQGLAEWLNDHFGKTAYHKEIPTWVLTMDRSHRSSLLEGYLSGDGNSSFHGKQLRFSAGSASKKLSLGLGLLAQGLGFSVGFTVSEIKVKEILGTKLKSEPAPSWRWRATSNGQRYQDDDSFVSYKISSVEQVEDQEFYGLCSEDNSYLAEGVIHHNTHPLILIHDEASDYPIRGWRELPETIQRKSTARWLSYGVTIGPGNPFDDKITGHGEDAEEWDVIKLPAMYRPTWTDEEREEKIKEYGGYEDIDYQRNVLGTAEGADSALIVWARLMSKCVDDDSLSSYNTKEYYKVRITQGMRNEMDHILDFIDPPYSHISNYDTFWMGMDYGLTTSDTCILIFAQTLMDGEKSSRLKLLSNISMSRISTPEQFQVIKFLLDLYKPKAFAFDAHGIGDGVFQLLQEEIRNDEQLSWMLDRVIGYSFSKKLIVGFDDTVSINLDIPDDWKRAAIEKITADASLDYLREFVDNELIYLPNDKELQGEIKAVPRKGSGTLNEYNKATRKKGGHQLDALRYALLAKGNETVREIIKEYEDSWTPAPLILMDYN